MHMMCELIGKMSLVEGLGERVLELLIADPRGPDEKQPSVNAFYAGGQIDKLNQALKLMQSNIEEPLSEVEIAELVGISPRQLQRYFREKCGRSPLRVYLELRLQRARMLVIRTGLEIEEVAMRTGFNSNSHFSFCYRKMFGQAPSVERRSTKPRPS